MGEPKSGFGRKVGPARRVTWLGGMGHPFSRTNFVSHVNGPPRFVRKSLISWLDQGSPSM